jgi:hypothetical protein
MKIGIRVLFHGINFLGFEYLSAGIALDRLFEKLFIIEFVLQNVAIEHVNKIDFG